MERKNKSWFKGQGATLLVLCAAAFFFWQMGGNSCWFYTVLGFPCPGCGMTRALLAASRGLWQQAFTCHPLFWTLPILAGLLLVSLLRQNKPDKLAWLRWPALLLAAVFLVVYLLRLIRFFPHTDPMRWNQEALLPRFFLLLGRFFKRT